MTPQAELQVQVRVLFPTDFQRVELREQDNLIPLTEMLLEDDNPADLSDQTMRLRVARMYDFEPDLIASWFVTRPETGNITVAPKPSFGNCACGRDVSECIGPDCPG